jgi:hypothetical protein
MKQEQTTILLWVRIKLFLSVLSFIMISPNCMVSQELPPRPGDGSGNPEAPPRPISVSVDLSQHLSFGAFYHGNIGGSVIIYPDGSRSSTGDVILLSMGFTFSTGILEVVGYPGTLVSILNGAPATLSGSNGGSMTINLGGYDPPSPFILTTIPPDATQVRVGGTLTVSNPLANPPGNYSGTYDVIFVQE